MKKAKKLLLGLLLFCIPVLTATAVLPVHAEQEASEAILSGSCGTNLTYTLNSDGVLTISGTGAMASGWKSTKKKRAPWAEDAYKAQVKTVVIEEGVTDIGEYAFYQCGVTSITLPSTLTEIKKEAFDGCANLEAVTIPESVTAIGNYAFTGVRL